MEPVNVSLCAVSLMAMSVQERKFLGCPFAKICQSIQTAAGLYISGAISIKTNQVSSREEHSMGHSFVALISKAPMTGRRV